MKPYYLLILVATCLFSSCEQSNKKALDKLVKRYPEIYGTDLIKSYKITRELYDYTDSIKLELLETNHNEQQIVIVSNTKGDAYAIPFPNNDNREYWSFYGENVNTGQLDKSKTFNIELNNALRTLSIKDNWTANHFLKEIFIDLFDCIPIKRGDTTTINGYFSKTILPDSCDLLIEKNYKSIFRNIEATISGFLNYNTFDDYNTPRIYQFNENPNSGKNLNYKIKVYRKPCVIKPVYM